MNEKTIKSVVFSSAVFIAAGAFASVNIGTNVKIGVANVDEGQTEIQSDAIEAVSSSRIMTKKGKGEYKLPSNLLLNKQAGLNMKLAQGSWTYVASDATAEVECPEVISAPSVITEKAQMWLDASISDSLVTSAATDNSGDTWVEDWLDCRENFDAAKSGTYTLPHAKASRHYYVDRLPILQPYLEKSSIYFGSPGSGRYMVWLNADGTTNRVNASHIFIVNAVKPESNLAWIIGSIQDGGFDTTDGSYWNMNSTIAQYGRAFLNGRNLDLLSKETTLLRGVFQLLEVDMMRLTVNNLDCFFNCRNYQNDSGTGNGDKGNGNRAGGNYLSEFILFTEKLTEAERLSIETYLMQKWNLGKVKERPMSVAINKGTSANFVSSEVNFDAIELLGNGTVTKTGNNDVYVVPSLNGGVAISTKPSTPGGPSTINNNEYAAGHVKVSSVNAKRQVFGGKIRIKEGSAYINAPVSLEVRAGEQVTSELQANGNKITLSNGAGEGAINITGNGFVALQDIPDDVKEVNVQSGTFILKAEQSAYANGAVNLDAGAKATIDTASFDKPSTTTVDLPEAGYYDLSFNIAENSDIKIYYDISIGETKIGKVHPLPNSSPKREVRFRTPWLSAGSYTLSFKKPDGVDGDAKIDDIELTLLPDMPDTNVIALPNGDFEDYYGENTFKFYNNANVINTKATGWTLEQPADDYDANNDGFKTPRAGIIFGNRPAIEFGMSGQRFGVNYGEAVLTFAGKGGIATHDKIKLKSGTYSLRAKIAGWAMWNYLGNWSWAGVKVSAKVVKRDGSEIELGTVNSFNRMSTICYWPNSFTLDADDEISIVLEGAGNVHIAHVDDIELVKGAEQQNLIVNGNFESIIGSAKPKDWEIAENVGDIIIIESRPYNSWTDAHWAKGIFEGKRWLFIRGTGWIRQTIKIPAAGNYRFTMHEHTRLTGNDNPGIKVTLANGEKEIELVNIPQGSDKSQEFIRWTSDFEVPSAGAWQLKIATLEESNTADKSSIIDDISLVKISEAATLPAPTSNGRVAIALSKDAKMRLDFTGEMEIGKLSIAGVRSYGKVKASDYPNALSGTGVLYIRDRGTKVIIR